MTPKVEPTVEKWEEISKKLRLCPECWTLSEGTGYCDCGGFKRLDFNDLPEEEKRAWVDGFERGESHSVQEAKEEMIDDFKMRFVDGYDRLYKETGGNIRHELELWCEYVLSTLNTKEEV